MSVFSDVNFKTASLLNDIRDIGITTRDTLTSKLQWKRADEVVPGFQKFIGTQIHPDAIGPNPSLPDYTFWKVLKHMASSPELVRSLFVIRNEDNRGKYSMYVGVGDEKQEIEIDTNIPVLVGMDGKPSPGFCTITNNDIWPILFEKAVLKAYGTASILMGNNFVKQYGTVGPYSFKKITIGRGESLLKSEIFDRSWGRKLAVLTSNVPLQAMSTAGGVKPNEAFPILKRVPNHSNGYLFKILTNTVETQAIGKNYAPNSPLFNDMLKRDIDYNPGPTYMYGDEQELSKTFTTLYCFDYQNYSPKAIEEINMHSFENKYLTIKNAIQNQEVVINFVQEIGKKPCPIRCLVGQLNPLQKKLEFVQILVSDEPKESLVLRGQDHLLIMDSESQQKLRVYAYHEGQIELKEVKNNQGDLKGLEMMIWRDFMEKYEGSFEKDRDVPSGSPLPVDKAMYRIGEYHIFGAKCVNPLRASYHFEGRQTTDNLIYDADSKQKA